MRFKEYNNNKVLETSLRLFWKKGFKGCSINDLVEATGVNRYSLYHEFEDKTGMLYHSLKLYRERYCKNFEILNKTDALDDILNEFFLSFFSDNSIYPGCYFIHIGTELADTDPKIKELISNYIEEVSNEIKQMLMRYSYKEEEAGHLANHLTGLYCTSMSFCLIHSDVERQNHIKNGISVILNKSRTYATSIT